VKMKPEHFEALRAAISEADTPAIRENYRKGQFPRSEQSHDKDKRYRWDLFGYAMRYELPKGYMSVLYAYLDDTHIDTALRNIVKPLET
jgi:hypothetical protein